MQKELFKSYEAKVNRILLLIALGVLITGSIVFAINTFILGTAELWAPFTYLGAGLAGLVPAAFFLIKKKGGNYIKFIVLFSLYIDLILFTYFSKASNTRSYTLIFVFIAFSAGYLDPKIVLLSGFMGILMSIIQIKINPGLMPAENVVNNMAMVYFAIVAFTIILYFVNKISRELLENIVDKEKKLDVQNQRNSEIIIVIKNNLEHLQKMKDNVYDFAQNLSKNSKDVAASVEEISATIEEWSVSTNAIAENSRMTSEAMGENVKLSEIGLQYMEESNKAFEHLVGSIGKIKEAISQIFEITEQTSLISLNAAIEAARAGEMGKSFSVVAKEIQKLADRSNTVVRDIESTIVESNTNITNTQEKNKKTYEIFNQMISRIQDVSKKFENISEATEEESKSTHDIITLLDDISKNTELTVLISEEIDKVSKNLQSVSNELTKKAFSSKTQSDVIVP